jgi:hypothetical protein
MSLHKLDQCSEVVHPSAILIGSSPQPRHGAERERRRGVVSGEEKGDRSAWWCAQLIAAGAYGTLAVRRRHCRVHVGRRGEAVGAATGAATQRRSSGWNRGRNF